jgi:glycosyltransferase involved in cell wall biosynthesis
MNYTIGITTFSARNNYLTKLLEQIRFFTDAPIIITINGEKEGKLSDEYMNKIFELCLKFKQIYPIFFQEIRGLSKMWNTIIVHSASDNILLLNDDIEIHNDDVFKIVGNLSNNPNFNSICKLNGSFSHFMVKKKCIEKIGFFDERLLGFGEEDGDITYRLIKHNIELHSLGSSGLINIVSDVRHSEVKPGIGKYSKFNRDFIYGQKYVVTNEGIRGMFDTPMKENLDNENAYPYEVFFRENKSKL